MRELPWFRIGGVALLGTLVLAIALVVRGGHTVPDHVQRIEWNRQACAHCQMLIGEPAHAAQLITAEGEVLSFDDPGCAVRYVERHRPHVHRMWFHHGTAERWLTSEHVGFLTGGTTPMGSGLIAVDRGAPGAIDLESATRQAVGVREDHR